MSVAGYLQAQHQTSRHDVTRPPTTAPSPCHRSLEPPSCIRVEEVEEAAVLQKPAAADDAQQRRREPALQGERAHTAIGDHS